MLSNIYIPKEKDPCYVIVYKAKPSFEKVVSDLEDYFEGGIDRTSASWHDIYLNNQAFLFSVDIEQSTCFVAIPEKKIAVQIYLRDIVVAEEGLLVVAINEIEIIYSNHWKQMKNKILEENYTSAQDSLRSIANIYIKEVVQNQNEAFGHSKSEFKVEDKVKVISPKSDPYFNKTGKITKRLSGSSVRVKFDEKTAPLVYRDSQLQKVE